MKVVLCLHIPNRCKFKTLTYSTLEYIVNYQRRIIYLVFEIRTILSSVVVPEWQCGNKFHMSKGRWFHPPTHLSPISQST